MNPDFRYATEEELQAIVSTYNSTIASRLVTADLEEISVESKREWFNKHDRKKRPLWTVYVENQYAGWMSFNSFYGRPAYDGTVEVSIYLEEKYRGQGIGKTCLEKALSFAPEAGIHTLLGFIFGHNSGSIRLFEKAGFATWGVLPGSQIWKEPCVTWLF